MAVLALFIGIITGLVMGAIGFAWFELSFWNCLAIYAFSGALATLGTALVAYLAAYGARNCARGWASQDKPRTAVG